MLITRKVSLQTVKSLFPHVIYNNIIYNVHSSEIALRKNIVINSNIEL